VQQRLRCQGHVINLAVQAFLFEGFDMTTLQCDSSDEKDDEPVRKFGALGKIHNISAFSRSSPKRAAEFKSLLGRMIPLDNKTRWNSWFRLLDVAIQHESKIDEYVKANCEQLEKDSLDVRDWKVLRAIHKFLGPFNRGTMELQGRNPGIEKVLIVLDTLLTHAERELV
jgi:hypothetical protein